jgi:phage terminase large subunit-like protein
MQHQCEPRWASPRLSHETEGEDVARFAEAFCRLTTDSYGGRAGDLIQLRDWQRELLADLYELKDGKRRHRYGLIGLPKKNGKSLLSSILCLYELVFGAPGSEVYTVANAKHQARIVFEPVASMVRADPELSELLQVQRNVIYNPRNGSVFRPLTSDVGSNDGLNPSLVIFDELHEFPDRRLYDQLHNATATRPTALLLAITTAGWDKGTLCYDRYEFGSKVANGEITEPSFFFRWWAPKDTDVPLTLADGSPNLAPFYEANPGLGDFQGVGEITSAIATMPENALRRYRLNSWTANYEAWLPSGAWDSCVSERTLEPNEPVVLGFDGSRNNDTTALVACTLDGFVAVIDCWSRPDRLPANEEWSVPILQVEDRIREACRTYDVRELAADPSLWQRSLELLAQEGLPVVAFPQSPGRMIPATAKFERAVREHLLTHDGNPTLARHVANAVAVESNGGIQIRKEAKSSPRKIDLAVASIMAHDRATFLASTYTPRPKVRAFSFSI